MRLVTARIADAVLEGSSAATQRWDGEEFEFDPKHVPASPDEPHGLESADEAPVTIPVAEAARLRAEAAARRLRLLLSHIRAPAVRLKRLRPPAPAAEA